MRWRMAAVMAATISIAAHAQDYHGDFTPGQLKGPRTGTPNQVMVLGSPHLSNMPPAFRAADLSSLLDRLAVWAPQRIAIEALSGQQCDYLRRYDARYAEVVKTYCSDPASASAATGLDVPAATAEATQLLRTWPARPTAADRRHLAAVFLAGGEPASALVQWLRLPAAERRAGDGLDTTLAARLDTLRNRNDESLLIAAALAARLGQERVFPMDDHTADLAMMDDDAFGAAVGKAWDNDATKQRTAAGKALEAQLGSPAGVLNLYRAYNARGQSRLVFDSDFGAALEEGSLQHFGRIYVGWWETRNLRMAANIREMLAEQPGTRALVIVGASHKGYLEAYLDQMHDVRLVSTDAVLR